MAAYKGLILAGGTGSRLWPLTRATSKQLMPVYDKPLIYYPLSTLMAAGLREIAIITTPQDRARFQDLLGDGAQWGISLSYIEQVEPSGLAQAYLLASEFLAGSGSVLILGDNLFDAPGLASQLKAAMSKIDGATIFGHQVLDPERFGVANVAEDDRVISLEEKPQAPKSDIAVTGLYVCDPRASTWADWLQPSGRGELEIVDLLNLYLAGGALNLMRLGDGLAAECKWLDTGTQQALFDASDYVHRVQSRQARMVGSPDFTALQQGWITSEGFVNLIEPLAKTDYGKALRTAAFEVTEGAGAKLLSPKGNPRSRAA